MQWLELSIQQKTLNNVMFLAFSMLSKVKIPDHDLEDTSFVFNTMILQIKLLSRVAFTFIEGACVNSDPISHFQKGNF